MTKYRKDPMTADQINEALRQNQGRPSNNDYGGWLAIIICIALICLLALQFRGMV